MESVVFTQKFKTKEKLKQVVDCFDNNKNNFNSAKKSTNRRKILNIVLELKIDTQDRSNNRFLFKQENIGIDFYEDTLYLSCLELDIAKSWSILLDSRVEFTNEIYVIFGSEECLNDRINKIFTGEQIKTETDKLYLLFFSDVDQKKNSSKIKIKFLP